MTPAETTEVQTQHQPPDPAAFDRRCRRFLGLQVQIAAMKKQAEELKALILFDVDTAGYIPDTAPRSRRLDSEAFVATVTTAITVEINDDQVFALELLLSRIRHHNDFPNLFQRHVSYTLAPTAPNFIKATKWPKKHAEEIVTTYALCTRPKVKSPALEVESRAAVAERERKAAEKVAAKAAKGSRARKVAA